MFFTTCDTLVKKSVFYSPVVSSISGFWAPLFLPQFGYKYVIEVIVPESKEKDVIKIVRDNSKLGKIFISQVSRAVDIGTGNEGDEVI